MIFLCVLIGAYTMGAGCEDQAPAKDEQPGPDDGDDLVVTREKSRQCNDAETNLVGSRDAEPDPVTVAVREDTVVVTDADAAFNCCLDAWMEARVSGDTIIVIEKEDPDKEGACRCMCSRKLEVEIPDMSDGTYTVLVYRGAQEDDTLLATKTVTVGGDAAEGLDTEDGRITDGDTERDTAIHTEPRVTEIAVDGCHGAATESRGGGDTEVSEEAPLEGERIYLVTQGDTVTVVDENGVFNCCYEVEVQVDIQETRITVTEQEIRTETGPCRCTCASEYAVTIEGLIAGDYAVEVRRAYVDGPVETVATLSFECLGTPDDWEYNGIACIS